MKKLFLIQNKIDKIENIENMAELEMLELGSNRVRVSPISVHLSHSPVICCTDKHLAKLQVHPKLCFVSCHASTRFDCVFFSTPIIMRIKFAPVYHTMLRGCTLGRTLCSLARYFSLKFTVKPRSIAASIACFRDENFQGFFRFHFFSPKIPLFKNMFHDT